MKDFNFNFLEKEVGTQYNDMCGLAAIDGHDSLSFNLKNYAKTKGLTWVITILLVCHSMMVKQ